MYKSWSFELTLKPRKNFSEYEAKYRIYIVLFSKNY